MLSWECCQNEPGGQTVCPKGIPHIVNFNLSAPSFMCGVTADWLWILFPYCTEKEFYYSTEVSLASHKYYYQSYAIPILWFCVLLYAAMSSAMDFVCVSWWNLPVLCLFLNSYSTLAKWLRTLRFLMKILSSVLVLCDAKTSLSLEHKSQVLQQNIWEWGPNRK